MPRGRRLAKLARAEASGRVDRPARAGIEGHGSMTANWTTAATVAALAQVEAVDPPRGYRATGFEPAVDLDLGADRRPGWYRVEVRIAADHPLQLRILPAFEGVPAAERGSVLRESDRGRFVGTFKAPAPFRRLRLEPGRRPGDFLLEEVAVVRMGPLAVLGMAAAGARRAARRGPGPLLRFLRDAAMTVLRPSRFETFQPAGAVGPDLDAEARYRLWIERHEPTLGLDDPPFAPGGPAPIAVVVPVPAGSDPARLAETLASLGEQVRPVAEIVLAGAAGAVAAVPAAPDRRVVKVEAGTGAAALVSAGLAATESRHAIVLAVGDRARPRLGAAFGAALDRDPDLTFAYADEDRVDAVGRRHDPVFKPAWSPVFLEAGPYCGTPVLFDRTALAEAGGLGPDRTGAEDFDLVLRLADRPGARVRAIGEVLVSRPAEAPAGWAPASAQTAAASGAAALADHFARRGGGAEATPASDSGRRFLVRRRPAGSEPLVSVVVPTRDRLDLLAVAIGSLRARTDWPALEVLVVDNGSAEPGTLEWLAREAGAGRVRVVRDDGPFNFARLNNRAVTEARGEVLCLLNNDIEVVEPGWLAEMVALALRDGVGPVGAKLLYPDRTVQHGGVLLGMHGVAGHMDVGLPATAPGFLGRLQAAQEVTAVTAAALVVRRSVWTALGGLDESFAVAFNDLDFCLRARALGHVSVFAGTAVLIHHESASRGADRDGGRRARYLDEAARFKARWGDLVLDDPMVSRHWDRTAGLWIPRL